MNSNQSSPCDGVVKEIASHLALKISPGPMKQLEPVRGLVETIEGKLFLMAVAPVLKSEGTGPAFGKVMSAKLLDVAEAQES